MRIRSMGVALGLAVSMMATPSAEAGGFLKKLFGCCKPEPVCCEPEPVCCEPEPVCCEPEPVCCEPEPVCCEPAPEPVCCPEPEPVVCCPEPEPTPVCCEPEPAPTPEPCCVSTSVGVSDVALTAGLPAGAVIVSTRVVSAEEMVRSEATSEARMIQLVATTR